MLGEGSIFAFSYEHHVGIDSFHYTFSDIIHLLHPLHLVGSFELLGDTFPDGDVGGEAGEQFLGLFIDVGEVGMELAGSE